MGNKIRDGMLWDAALGGLTKGASTATSLNKTKKAVKALDLADDVFLKEYLEKNAKNNIIKIDIQFFPKKI